MCPVTYDENEQLLLLFQSRSIPGSLEVAAANSKTNGVVSEEKFNAS